MAAGVEEEEVRRGWWRRWWADERKLSSCLTSRATRNSYSWVSLHDKKYIIEHRNYTEFPETSFDKTTFVDSKLLGVVFPRCVDAPRPNRPKEPISFGFQTPSTNGVETINLPGQ